MNCSDCQELLSEYLDGDLGGSKHRAVAEHLDFCRECLGIYQDLHQIVLVSRELPNFAPQSAHWQKIEREIVQLTQVPLSRPSLWTRFWHYRFDFSISLPQLAGGLAILLVAALASMVSYLPQN